MWWGISPPLDFQNEVQDNLDLEILVVGEADARHVVKTISASHTHPERKLKFHLIEPTLEQINRSILLISIFLEKDLGLQEATRYYLEILGNTLLKPATAKFLLQRVTILADILTEDLECPWLNLEFLKHRERDQIESIFRFWVKAVCEGLPITEYWDRRIRKSLGSRYDYREGVFDWDYNMVLKLRNAFNLTQYEYKFWRENGIAFTWIEGEPARANPTLISNIIKEGRGYLHYAYLGDISSGPFFTWALNENYANKKFRSTDVAEREVMKAIYEVRMKETMCEKVYAAHRDLSILNGTIVTEMPSSEIELEAWTGDKVRKDKISFEWIKIPEVEILVHSASNLCRYKDKEEFRNRFSLISLSHNMTKQIPNLAPLLKTNSPLIVESPKFAPELRKDDLEEFNRKLKTVAENNGLRTLDEFNSSTMNFARFYKRSELSLDTN